MQQLEESMGYLVGDCLMAAAFLSYSGPFLSQYRDELVQETWLKQVRFVVAAADSQIVGLTSIIKKLYYHNLMVRVLITIFCQEVPSLH